MIKGAKKNAFPESLIVKIWQHQLLDQTELTTEEGEPLKIIYPGRINDDRGADLREAVIATSRGLVKGDVEVHIKSSSWWAHRHHRDPIYNRVMLHVVFWHDAGVSTNLQNGGTISTLALCKYIKSPIHGWANFAQLPDNLGMPCHKAVKRLDTDFVGEYLDSAGEERFFAKAEGFQASLAQTEPGQALYQGVMSALGYARNKVPFLELARRLPLNILEAMTRGKISDAECLARQQALLLGTAGLLPSQSCNLRQEDEDAEWVEKLEKVWGSSRQIAPMSESDWDFFKVRPNNLPARRMVAISYLVLRYREEGILAGLINKLNEAPVGMDYCGLEKLLVVADYGYWAGHFDFCLPGRLISPTLLGNGRAADIVVNVLLPFAFAWGGISSQQWLARKAFDHYRCYPRLAVNTIERHMSSQLGLDSNLVNSARRQQGLIHIYKTLCSQGECHRCFLGGAR
ncbi:DUF2851 family protein [Chloroflexota bacterium]